MQANLRREAANFLVQPHGSLYPCAWGPDEQMLPQAKVAFTRAFLNLAEARWPDVRSWVRFAVIGSGASYNWAEDGDFDIQVWVADESRLPAVRRLIVDHLLHLTFADFGLATGGCPGTMGVQFYAKPGRGTPEENLAGQPYACYDLDLDRWLVKPIPLTPELYGDLFLLALPRAEEVANEAEDLLADYDRARRDADYWTALNLLNLNEGNPAFDQRAALATALLAEKHAAVKAMLRQLMGDRMQAYTETGRGIYDERDAIWKLLEVWGIADRLKHVGQGKPGVAG